LDPVLQARRNDVNNQITAVKSRATAVEKMSVDLQTQLDEIHRNASNALDKLVKHKVSSALD
jgi:ribosome recycling factor